MPLNMNNYKGYDKRPYCNSHYPKQSFTIVADTPENLRLKKQSELQSQVKYRQGFEESKRRGYNLVPDTPELHRLCREQDQISDVKYHKNLQQLDVQHRSQGMHGHYLVRAQVTSNKPGIENPCKDVHQYTTEVQRRPGVIVAPVLPGAYYHCGQAHGHSYMHQIRMHSLRKTPPTMSVFRALFDYTAHDTDEVSFRDGDIILQAQPIDDGWLYGTVQRTGHSGLLPANYVEGIH